MELLQLELARRIRFRSWKDVVVFIAMCLFYVLLTWAAKKLFPNLSEKVTNSVIAVIMVILTVILLIAVGD